MRGKGRPGSSLTLYFTLSNGQLGADILRHLDDERSVQEQLGVFVDRARGIAEGLDDWSLRERDSIQRNRS